jgi:general secretion pathway protein B
LSYILDALRRADAERELGVVPTLHAQAAPGSSVDDGFGASPVRAWRWVPLGLVLLAAGWAAWLFIGRDVPVPKPTEVAVPAVVQPVAEVPLSSQPVPLVEPVAAPIVAAATANAPPLTSESRVMAAPTAAPQTEAIVIASPPAASAAEPKKMASPAASKILSKTPAAVLAAAPQKPIVAFNELPEALRREQPTLSVGGAMHSANPANRMLILNGQVFHEGDQVTPDLLLEQIKLKSAVLVYKGTRYSINY